MQLQVHLSGACFLRRFCKHVSGPRVLPKRGRVADAGGCRRPAPGGRCCQAGDGVCTCHKNVSLRKNTRICCTFLASISLYIEVVALNAALLRPRHTVCLWGIISRNEYIITARLLLSGALSALKRAQAHTLPGHRPQVWARYSSGIMSCAPPRQLS
jgi:hypothetical protein